MKAWKMQNAGFKDEGAAGWLVRSHGGQRLLWARLLVMFGPATILFIALNIFLDDSETAACIVAASLIASIPLALSFRSSTTLTINELLRTLSLSATSSFLFGPIRRERKAQYESADLSSAVVTGNLLGSNWKTEIRTYSGDSITVYFGASEQNARLLAEKVSEISEIQISESSTPEVGIEVTEKGVETWRLVLAAI
jgi:hypothetical protein